MKKKFSKANELLSQIERKLPNNPDYVSELKTILDLLQERVF